MSYGNQIALLGLVADHRRVVKNGSQYDHLIPPSSGTYQIVNSNGTVRHTVEEMDKFTRATLDDTKRLAPTLKGATLVDTLRNVFSFWYNHCQYKMDKDGVEELRRPKRSWRDGQILTRNPQTEPHAGIDCDCFSIAVASTLINLGIDCKFRITAYDGGWQHVYVIVPLPNNSEKYYVIDCVLNSFNEEKTYSKKFDYKMSSNLSGIPIAILGSINDDVAAQNALVLNDVINGVGFDDDSIVITESLNAPPTAEPLLDNIYKHLVATRNYMRSNPDSLVMVGGAENNLKMIEYAIEKWNTPERDKALEILEKEEERWSNSTQSIRGIDEVTEDEIGDASIDDFEELGKLSLKKGGKTFFKNIKKSVNAVQTFNKKIATKIIGEKAVDKIQKIKDKAKEAGKKAFSVIKKFVVMSNPLSLMARAGFLLAMKVNLFQMAQRLYPGLLTGPQAANQGIGQAAWERSKNGLDKVAKVFEKLGGRRSKLEAAIKNGRAKTRFTKGFSGIALGDGGISEAVTIVSAATALLTAASKMKQAGVNKKDYEQVQKNQEPTKKGVRGLGDETTTDVEVPEEEQFDTDSSGNIDESKKGLAKFIAAIKKFFSKNKHAESYVNQESQRVMADEEQSAANPEEAKESVIKEATIAAEEAKAEAIAQGKTETEAQQIADDKVAEYGLNPSDVKEKDNFFAKAVRFAKENPVKTAIGATVAVAGISLLFPSVRKGIAGLFSGNKKGKSSNASLSGAGKTSKKLVKKLKSKAAKMHVKRVEF